MERKLRRVQMLEARVRNIHANARYNNKEREQYSRNYQIEIDRQYQWMQQVLKKTRLSVAREYHKIAVQQKNPQAPQLMHLKMLKERLNDYTNNIDTLMMLAKSPKASTNDPRLDGLQGLHTPTTQPIMSKKQEEKFVNTAISGGGWNQASKDMEKYAKENRVSAREVKSQVVDNLLEKRFHQVFGEKPRNMSNIDEPSTPKTPRRPK